MEIPLALRASGPGRLVYTLPAWYRVVMALVAALVLASLFIAGGSPGIIGWVVMALVAFGALYEERWTFDAERKSIAHRAGLVFWARETRVELSRVKAFRLSAFVRGTVPGSAEEAADKEAALALGRGDDAKRGRSFHKKPYLSFVLEAEEGEAYLVNMVDARKGAALREAATKIAAHCGAPLIEG